MPFTCEKLENCALPCRRKLARGAIIDVQGNTRFLYKFPTREPLPPVLGIRMCSTGQDAHSLSHSESPESLTDFSMCELAGEVESLIRARCPRRSLRQYLQVYPCDDFDTNRASAVAWLKKLLDRLKVQQIGIKSSYVLVPSVDVCRASVPLRSLREGTGFLRSCSHCGSALLQLDGNCPVCQRVDSSPRNFEGKPLSTRSQSRP